MVKIVKVNLLGQPNMLHYLCSFWCNVNASEIDHLCDHYHEQKLSHSGLDSEKLTRMSNDHYSRPPTSINYNNSHDDFPTCFFCNNNTNKSWQHNSKENCRPGTGNTSKRRKTAPLQTIQPWRIPSSPWRPRLIMIIMLSKRENHPIIPLYNKRWFIVNLNYVISPPKVFMQEIMTDGMAFCSLM